LRAISDNEFFETATIFSVLNLQIVNFCGCRLVSPQPNKEDVNLVLFSFNDDFNTGVTPISHITYQLTF
jgi:hypothetical protein